MGAFPSDLPELPGEPDPDPASHDPTVRLPNLEARLREHALRGGAVAGDSIGPYQLLSLLGEGGFGEVWLAERREPFMQRVALKLIKAGMDSKAVLARFEQERQALAVMDHPNIAHVLDGGITVPAMGSRPYFVMEHVQGESITVFCDRHTYTVKQRLELFAQVCEAVQHAHHKGIIHRDLKPSNILVSPKDDRAIPKVIDFGVAKAISRTLTQRTIYTEQGLLIGTPEYMSPEQAEMGATDIDTRTDVYSLGVVLYELLTGVLPFESGSLRAAGFDSVRRIIREQDPPKPSTRLTSLDRDAGAEIARKRQSDRDDLGKELRRELDWIPLKAMRKDRAHRYRTPGEMADDIRRYLRGEPLAAGPESAAYQARKFIRRHRTEVVAGAALAVTLCAAALVSIRYALKAHTQRDRAIAAETQAQQRADQLQKVADFQAEMLEQIDAAEAGEALTADVAGRLSAALTKAGVPETERAQRIDEFAQQWSHINATDAALALIDTTILSPAVKAIDEKFKDQPVVDALLRQVLAIRYRQLGLLDAAEPLQKAALATRRATLGDWHADTLESVNAMGELLRARGRMDEAARYFQEAADGRRRLLGVDHQDTATSINNLGVALRSQGKLDEALPLYTEALDIRRRILGPEAQDTLSSVNNLGSLLRAMNRLDEAESAYREALEARRRTLDPEHLDTLNSINNMASLLQARGKLNEARPLYVEALGIARRKLGSKHPRTLIALNNLAFLLQAEGKPAEAEAYFREAVESARNSPGMENPNTLQFFRNLGSLLRTLKRPDEAVTLLLEAEPAARRIYKDPNTRPLGSLLMTLGQARADLGQFAAAEPTLLEAHAILAPPQGTPHKDARECAKALADLYEAWERAEPEKGHGAKAEKWKTADRSPPG